MLKKKSIALLLITFINLPFLALAAGRQSADELPSYKPLTHQGHNHQLSPITENGYVLQQADGMIVCRDATSEESQSLSEREQDVPLHVISDFQTSGLRPHAGGLTIILRATQQLESFPQAKSIFIKAAQKWQGIIQTPITVIIDVDFGSTRFGQPYPSPDILGSTNSQLLRSSYPEVRNGLIPQASSSKESQLYNLLPVGAVPTDIGSATSVIAPSALYRAVNLLSAVADPANEASLGSPPSIGFNSAFPFDFDSSNGVDADKFDFESVAIHEIGHALGFSSNVGLRELSTSFPIAPSFLDLFRFRPGTNLSSFSNASRIQFSGGEQVFFADSTALALSTGRPDGSGGDGRQASHWKDNDFTGQYIGVMDPAIPPGTVTPITSNDLFAFDMMGYQVSQSTEDSNAPSILSLQADLNGDTLTFTGVATDSTGDIVQAQSNVLNSAGQTVGQSAPFAVSFGSQTLINFTLQLNNLSAFPQAMQASLTFIDSQGNRSAAVIADFSKADQGGPSLDGISYNGKKMTIKGLRLSGQLKVEINGEVVVTGPNSSSKKLKVKGNRGALNLGTGPNRVRIINGTLRSNLRVLNL